MVRKIKKGQTHELTEISTQFVSLVNAGANRQSKFMVVKADGDKNKGNEQDGEQSDPSKKDDAENLLKTDLSGWLEEAGSSVDTAMQDAEFDLTLSLFDTEEDEQDLDSKKLGKVGEGEVPAPNSADSDDNEEDSGDLAKIAKEKAEAEAEAARLRKELKTEKLKTAKIRQASIGGSSSLLTGEVGSTAKHAESDDVPKRKSWKSGQDLAKE